MRKNRKPATTEAKTEEAANADIECKVSYNMAKRNYQKLCGTGGPNDMSPTLIYEDIF